MRCGEFTGRRLSEITDNHFPAAVDRVGTSARGDQRVQLANAASAGKRNVRDRRQAFLDDVIDHDEHPEASAANELVMSEVERQPGVGPFDPRNRRSGYDGAAAVAASLRNAIPDVSDSALPALPADASENASNRRQRLVSTCSASPHRFLMIDRDLLSAFCSSFHSAAEGGGDATSIVGAVSPVAGGWPA